MAARRETGKPTSTPLRREEPLLRGDKASRSNARRGVAQPGSAPAWGAGGRQFKSGRPDSPSPLPGGTSRSPGTEEVEK